MTRGRKPKPTVLKLVTDNPGNRPLNAAEPKPVSRALQAPDILLPEARAEWDRVADDLVAAGLITVADLASLAIYCTAYGRWVQAERLLAVSAKANPETEGLTVGTPNGAVIQNPLLGIRNKALADLMKASAELGMTPSARSRVQAAARPTADPADAFFN
jgi:P27 family predicted phage terminase small subunit